MSTVGKFICHECSISFTRHHGLTRHQSSVHLQQRHHSCPQCGKTFGQQAQLSDHLLVHSGSLPYQCRVCPRTFASRRSRQRHLLQHSIDHQQQSYPYHCDVDGCTAAFITSYQLRQHQVSHAPVKDRAILFVCQHCQQSLASQRTLMQHIQNKHSESSEAQTRKAVRKRKRRGDANDSDNDKGASADSVHSADVVHHLFVNHDLAARKSHLCDRCGAGFVNAANLKRHQSSSSACSQPQHNNTKRALAVITKPSLNSA